MGEPWYNKVWDVQNSLLDRMITEETGISVEISSGGAEKTSVLIASGDLPDVLAMPVWSSNHLRLQLENAGWVWNLNELISQYAPDLGVPQDMIDWYTNPTTEGWYSLMNYYFSLEELERGAWLTTHNTLYARSDIQVVERIKSGAVFATDQWAHAQWGMRDLFNADNKAIFIGVGPIRAADGAQPTLN